jgi:hypothetical protein
MLPVNTWKGKVPAARKSPFGILSKHSTAPHRVSCGSKNISKKNCRHNSGKFRLPVTRDPAEEEVRRWDDIARSHCLNAPISQLYALMLRLATFFFGFLEGRKVYELRKQNFDISKCERILLVCTAPVRKQTGINYILEGNIVWKSEALTAEQIVQNPEYLAGTMLTEKEVTDFLGSGKGYLYRIANVRRSELVWFHWLSNGSNCFGFVPQFVDVGEMHNFPRFGPVEWDQPRWREE